MSGSTRLCATIVSKSFPPTETPCHLSTLRSNLRLCPTFSIRSDSSTARNPSRIPFASAASCGTGPSDLGNPLPLKHAQVELEVVPDLLDPVRFKHRTKPFQNPLRLSGVLRHGDVIARVRREGEREPHQARLFGVEASGLGVKAEAFQLL